MDEHVLAAAVGLDEAVALLRVEPFDDTGSQSRPPLECGGSAPCFIGARHGAVLGLMGSLEQRPASGSARPPKLKLACNHGTSGPPAQSLTPKLLRTAPSG